MRLSEIDPAADKASRDRTRPKRPVEKANRPALQPAMALTLRPPSTTIWAPVTYFDSSEAR